MKNKIRTKGFFPRKSSIWHIWFKWTGMNQHTAYTLRNILLFCANQDLKSQNVEWIDLLDSPVYSESVNYESIFYKQFDVPFIISCIQRHINSKLKINRGVKTAHITAVIVTMLPIPHVNMEIGSPPTEGNASYTAVEFSGARRLLADVGVGPDGWARRLCNRHVEEVPDEDGVVMGTADDLELIELKAKHPARMLLQN